MGLLVLSGAVMGLAATKTLVGSGLRAAGKGAGGGGLAAAAGLDGD